MRKEYITHKIICDSCGEEKYEGSAFTSSVSSWHTLYGDDLCFVCFMSIVDNLVSERFVSEDDYKSVKNTFIRNTRHSPFGSGSTATFEFMNNGKENKILC
jgi:hypothetical protein